MIWKGETMDQYEERASEYGIRCFAILPMQMDNGFWVWLDWYWAGMRLGYNNRWWVMAKNRVGWVRAIKREDCIYHAPQTPPPPKPHRDPIKPPSDLPLRRTPCDYPVMKEETE